MAPQKTNSDELAAELQDAIAGDVAIDSYSRRCYATDASLYQEQPIAVAFPQSTADVSQILTRCTKANVPVLPRGAGTSLAGQTVNSAVVLDFTRYMDTVAKFDPENRTVTVQPGATLATITERADDAGLRFGPNPSYGNVSTIGGAIGNNSTGSHSLRYGATAETIVECEVVLADGTVTAIGTETVAEIEDTADWDGDLLDRFRAAICACLADREKIDTDIPDLHRNVAGYNLDGLLAQLPTSIDDDTTINLAQLLAGSEGTLAVVTEATIRLAKRPADKETILLCYDSVSAATDTVPHLLEHDPAAVELVDDVLIDRAGTHQDFAQTVEPLPDDTAAVLLVEWFGTTATNPGELREAACAQLATCETLDSPITTFIADSESERDRYWKLRKSGLPLLLSHTTDDKHISIIEDGAVPPTKLTDYVEEVTAILEEHDTDASFYGHAGPGVLHVRPRIDTTTQEGIKHMESIASDVADLVCRLGGSISGEHGDGRVRSQFLKRQYSETTLEHFEQIKRSLDPDWLLNPGPIVPPPGEHPDMTASLRHGPDRTIAADFDPFMDWDDQHGVSGAVELCHGCGYCRGTQSSTGGTMCPTFRATEDELLTTRGRANLLRQALAGDMEPEEYTSQSFQQAVIEACIGCKGCKNDCPSGVDLAKLRAEFKHQHTVEDGPSLTDRLFGNIDMLATVGSAFAPLSNAIAQAPGMGQILNATVGLAPGRDLPAFRRNTFCKRVQSAGHHVGAAHHVEYDQPGVIVVPDLYSNYIEPHLGMVTVELFEQLGVPVVVADLTDVGRPAYSRGLLGTARETGRTVVKAVSPAVSGGWDIVCIDPTDAVMLQDDYKSLFDKDVAEIAGSTYGITEYLDRNDIEVPTVDTNAVLAYHGHCQQKGTGRANHAARVLDRAGFTVTPLDSGCCGMAGTIGFEASRYEMSQTLADILIEQIDTADPDIVAAPGASCRMQLADSKYQVAAPVELLMGEIPE